MNGMSKRRKEKRRSRQAWPRGNADKWKSASWLKKSKSVTGLWGGREEGKGIKGELV